MSNYSEIAHSMDQLDKILGGSSQSEGAAPSPRPKSFKIPKKQKKEAPPEEDDPLAAILGILFNLFIFN